MQMKPVRNGVKKMAPTSKKKKKLRKFKMLMVRKLSPTSTNDSLLLTVLVDVDQKENYFSSSLPSNWFLKIHSVLKIW